MPQVYDDAVSGAIQKKIEAKGRIADVDLYAKDMDPDFEFINEMCGQAAKNIVSQVFDDATRIEFSKQMSSLKDHLASYVVDDSQRNLLSNYNLSDEDITDLMLAMTQKEVSDEIE